jgi:hypothetical protein
MYLHSELIVPSEEQWARLPSEFKFGLFGRRKRLARQLREQAHPQETYPLKRRGAFCEAGTVRVQPLHSAFPIRTP